MILIAGVLVLYFTAELLVKGASRLALSFNIKPIIIGLTVVAMGTSFPEFVVSLLGAIQSQPDIAIGNIVGSNIANIGLILGVSAMIYPMKVHLRLIKVELPFLFIVSVLLVILSLDGNIGRPEALGLLTIFIGFIYYTVKGAGQEEPDVQEEFEHEIRNGHKRSSDIALILVGLAGIGMSAQMVVVSASAIARSLGISEIIIGVTMVAIGTSLPELATSVVAAFKKEPDISIGNIIGSNLFNILFVTGSAAAIYPIKVSAEALFLHMPVMMAFTIAVIPIMIIGYVIKRWEGFLLLAGYIGYMVYLFGVRS